MGPLAPFVYAFGLGGLVFAVGLFFAWRHGYIDGSARGLRNLAVSLCVALVFLVLQGYLQFGSMSAAPQTAYSGGADHVLKSASGMRGTALDYAVMIAYFAAILVVGTWFSRRQKTTKDFFLAGQRFSWWLIAFSLIATTIGSYSFVKYSENGFAYGLSSSQAYLNDWIWFPLLVFGWLPILYFSRVASIPEYFGRRFDSSIRLWATLFVLVYLVGYIGVNLFTMGRVLHELVGWDVLTAAAAVAVVSGIYVTAGGQTSVVMTDLLQGVMLLGTGIAIIVLGMNAVGGAESLWAHLPREARFAFPNFNEDPDFPSVGVFWQDGIANTAMFYFLNQGIIMRFLAARSLSESRKAALATVVVLMTVGAAVVGGGGWVARALVQAGQLPSDIEPKQAFYIATELLSRPGMFGLILAALTAALMSTIDTVITAVAAVVVNDIYKPYVRPAAGESELLKVARFSSIGVTVFGIVLVPVFNQFRSIYEAHAAFTAAVTPPLVVTLLLSVFWRRYTRTAALCTLVGGLGAIGLSLFVPEIIRPFAHGVPMEQVDATFLSGMQQFPFMRACFGMCVCVAIGVGVSLLTPPDSFQKQRGLVWGTIPDALARFKGGPGVERAIQRSSAFVELTDVDRTGADERQLPLVRISRSLAAALACAPGDLLYVTDTRWWLGGLKSVHVLVDSVSDDPESRPTIQLGPDSFARVVVPRRVDREVLIERLY